jgi:hypothetical protein
MAGSTYSGFSENRGVVGRGATGEQCALGVADDRALLCIPTFSRTALYGQRHPIHGAVRFQPLEKRPSNLA